MYKSLRLLQENSWGPSAGSSRDHIKIGKRAEKQPTTHSDSFLTKLKSPISGRGTLTIPCKICVFVSSEWGKSINQALSSVTFWNLGEICQLASRLLCCYQVIKIGMGWSHWAPSRKLWAQRQKLPSWAIQWREIHCQAMQCTIALLYTATGCSTTIITLEFIIWHLILCCTKLHLIIVQTKTTDALYSFSINKLMFTIPIIYIMSSL